SVRRGGATPGRLPRSPARIAFRKGSRKKFKTLLRILLDHSARDFRHKPTMQLEAILHPLIVLPGSRLTVKARAMNLNGNLLRRPGEVDLGDEMVRLNDAVAFDRPRYSRFTNCPSDVGFKDAVHRQLISPLGEQRSQLRDALSTARSIA